MREQLNVKQRQAISETPAKGGGGLVETCFSSLGRMVAFPGKQPWLGCCLQGSVLIECYLKHVRRISTDRRRSRHLSAAARKKEKCRKGECVCYETPIRQSRRHRQSKMGLRAHVASQSAYSGQADAPACCWASLFAGHRHIPAATALPSASPMASRAS
jgi:hypothetical protein